MIERALVVGVGGIGARHLRLLREATPKADIRVLRSSGCGEATTGADGCFERLEDACAFAPEVVVIANPAPFHLGTAQALAEVGAHLLIEKPLAATSADIKDFLSFCAAQKQVVQVGYNLRLLETLKRFRAEVQSGGIGPVRAVRCEVGQYLPEWRPGRDYRDTVSARFSLGGGALLELSHELDMLRWVFGDFAWVGGWSGQLSNLEIDVEDCAHLTMGFRSGAGGQVSLDLFRRDTTRCCTAVGEHGTLRWDAVAGEVSLYEPDTGAWRVLFADRPDRDQSYRTQMDIFLCAVASAETAADTPSGDGVASGADGLAVLSLIDAARRSAANDGCRISVTEA